MSFDKINETSNISKKNSFSNDKDKDNNNLNNEQIIKKNKIINIRIYQNYSTNKNSNTFYPYTNNFVDINNNLKKETNEIGIQTETEIGNNNKISITHNNYIKNIDYFYRSLSQDRRNIDKMSLHSHNNISRTYSCIKDKIIDKHNNKDKKKKRRKRKEKKRKRRR